MTQNRPKRVVDLVFLVDVTGSMQPCIDGLKASIKTFFDYLTDEDKNNLSIRDWRAKVVGYRDVAFDDDWIENGPFSSSVDEVRAQIDALDAHGGGDEPESLIDALLTVANMEESAKGEVADGYMWRNKRDAARAIVVFTDATYHPRAQREDYNGADIDDLFQVFAQKRIILEVITPTEPEYVKHLELDSEKEKLRQSFKSCYEDMATLNQSEWIKLKDAQNMPVQFSELDKHRDLFRDFLAQLARTLSGSVDPVAL